MTVLGTLVVDDSHIYSLPGPGDFSAVPRLDSQYKWQRCFGKLLIGFIPRMPSDLSVKMTCLALGGENGSQ